MVNDYLVQWRTANHDSVATQMTHYKTNSFAIHNQARHVTNRTYRLLNVKRALRIRLGNYLDFLSTVSVPANAIMEYYDQRSKPRRGRLLIQLFGTAILNVWGGAYGKTTLHLGFADQRFQMNFVPPFP